MARLQLFRLYLELPAPVLKRADKQGTGSQSETLELLEATDLQACVGLSSPQVVACLL